MVVNLKIINSKKIYLNACLVKRLIVCLIRRGKNTFLSFVFLDNNCKLKVGTVTLFS